MDGGSRGGGGVRDRKARADPEGAEGVAHGLSLLLYYLELDR